MADEAVDPISQARQGVNWLVGLSGAAIGGALAKLDWILKFPPAGKNWFLIAAFFFFLSILAGVFYAFELFVLKQRKLKLDEEKANTVPDQNAIDQAKKLLKQANEKVARFHRGTMVTFALAGAATLLSLFFVLRAPAPLKPPVTVPNHYVVNHVLVHAGGRLTHSHTFLVDQQTGDVWLMTCRNDKTVEFRRVQKLKVDGTPESVVATSNPAVR